MPYERILIVKLGAIGDVVNSLPLVCRLRDAWPDARIEWAIAPLAHGLVRGHPAVDRFRVLDVRERGSWLPFVRGLRAQRYDLAVDLQRLLKSGLIARLSGAPVRAGFDPARCKEHSHRFTNLRLAPNPSPGTTLAQYLELADLLGAPPAPVRWDLPWRASGADAAGLPAAERTRPGPRVVLNLGASKEANLWPAASWAALARALAAEHGAEVCLSGGPADRPRAAEVAAAVSEARDFVGTLALQETAGLLRSADLVVACDTGPLHMAVALGRPVVALFGAPDPARTGPFGQPEAVVRHAVECSPCRLRRCPIPGHPCMTGLTPEVVLARCAERLAAPPRATEAAGRG